MKMHPRTFYRSPLRLQLGAQVASAKVGLRSPPPTIRIRRSVRRFEILPEAKTRQSTRADLFVWSAIENRRTNSWEGLAFWIFEICGLAAIALSFLLR